jgi:hypothetical protein
MLIIAQVIRDRIFPHLFKGAKCYYYLSYFFMEKLYYKVYNSPLRLSIQNEQTSDFIFQMNIGKFVFM